jgi:imidazolonepropionase
LNLFIKNISQLVTVAADGKRAKTCSSMGELGIVADAGVLCREGKITWVGPMREWKEALTEEVPELDAAGMVVLPGFVDSHTHAMFAGSREHEFALRAAGATYRQITEQGGGILETVRQVRAATKKDLKRSTIRRLNEMMKSGTTTVEIKSGYGLEMDAEVKMLEAIDELREEEVIGVVGTFLGAHAVPQEYRDSRNEYLALLRERMIPYVGKKRLAEFCDVFCDSGYFDPEESEQILKDAKQWGMRPKLHAEELSATGGAELAVRLGAVSADHLEQITEAGIRALAGSDVVATLLPGVSFFLNHAYAPARKLIDAGAVVAIASDFNPGSCMSFSMPMMMTIACTQMQMTPEEALTAATLNGAAALGISASVGSIEAGKQADMVIADMPDYRFLAYHFGVNQVRHVVKHGTLLEF